MITSRYLIRLMSPIILFKVPLPKGDLGGSLLYSLIFKTLHHVNDFCNPLNQLGDWR
jgi:hypothetical protein